MAIPAWLEGICGREMDSYDHYRSDFYERFNAIADFSERPFTPKQVQSTIDALQVGHYAILNLVGIRRMASARLCAMASADRDTRNARKTFDSANDLLNKDSREIRDMIDELRDMMYDINICPIILRVPKKEGGENDMG